MFLWAHERQLHRLGRTLPYMQETSHFSWWWCKNRRYIPTFAIIKPRTHTTEFHMSSVICRARYSHCLLRLFKKSKINPQVRQRGAPDTNTLINIKNCIQSSLSAFKFNNLQAKSKINKIAAAEELYVSNVKSLDENYLLIPVFIWLQFSMLPILCCELQFSKSSRP